MNTLKRLILIFLVVFLSSLIARSQTDSRLDWGKIESWNVIGTGENQAALIVQFGENDFTDHAYVWVYRWDTPAEEYDSEGYPTVNGETMLRAIAGGSYDLDILTQYTGPMGSTVAGLGVSFLHSVLDYVEFDFKGASVDNKVTFNYFTSTGNQTSAPGNYTPELCKAAIERARTTHIIDHPINAHIYGAPAYDYDHWGSDDLATFSIDDNYWQAGWYDGYWAFWTGKENLRRLSFSGLGMSSTPLSNGDVHAWIFTPLDRNQDQSTGSIQGAQLSKPLDYSHFDFSLEVGVEGVVVDESVPEYFTLSGIRIKQPMSGGIYLERRGNSVKKIMIN